MIFCADIFLDAPGRWPMAAGLALLAVIAVGRLYIPQVRALALPWRWLLPALRCAALVALAASILKPVVVRSATPWESGQVVIVVDRSQSMSARDLAWLSQSSAAAAEEKNASLGRSTLVSMADGLGLLPAGLRDPGPTQLRANLATAQNIVQDWKKASDEYQFARASGADFTAARLREGRLQEEFRNIAFKILDKSGSFTLSPAASQTAYFLRYYLTRNQAINQINFYINSINSLADWAQDVQISADMKLYQSSVQVRQVCDQLADLSRFGRVEFAVTGGDQPAHGLLTQLPPAASPLGYALAESVQPMSLNGKWPSDFSAPTGASTDLVDGLQSILTGVGGRPIQAVVLFSDGRQTTAQDYAPLINNSAVPIFCVDVAAPSSLLHDVAVTRLLAPDCFVGETVTARAQVQASGDMQLPQTVSLSVDGAAPVTRPATVGADPVTVEFPVNFDKAGVHRLTASVPASPESATDRNKKIDRWVKVIDDKINIGIYSGAPGWDYQYVSNALSRTPWVSLSRAILPTGGDKLDLTPEQILSLNLLILDDVPITALSRPQWEAVNRLVSDRGGSVLLIAGDENTPRYVLHPLTGSLLPYPPGRNAVWRDWPGNEAGFHLAPAAGTRLLDALKLDSEPSDAASDSSVDADQYWARLPAFFRYYSLPQLKPAARALLIERDSSAPLLVENRVGLGRTFFLSMNESWRWRYKVGERDQDRFWLQFVRWAADQPYAAHSGSVWLDADPVAAAPLQPIHIRARVIDENQQPSQSPTQIVELYRGDDLFRKITLSPLGGEHSADPSPGRYEATVADLPAGNYQLRLHPPQGAGSDHAAVLPLHIAPGSEAELANLAGDPNLLRKFAQDSGGAYLTLDQIQTLPDLIHRATISQPRQVQRSLWDSYYLFGFVLACFGVEWAIRKRMGLV